MTTWVLWISKDYPEHWDRAVEHGLWDMLRERDVKAGDDVFFWQAGRRTRLLGWTRATTDARPLRADEVGPWSDAATADYRRRFHFSLVSDTPERRPKWGEVAAATGLTPAPQIGIVWTNDPDAQAWIMGLFAESPPAIDLRFDDKTQIELEDLLDDTRERASRTIALRRGQPQFRDALLRAYDNRCAVTGTQVVEVLEAAHISPYKGTHTNVVSNGLLLRADVHTLFDLHLLTISADLLVRVSPNLVGSPYEEFDERPLASLPRDPAHRPAAECLEAHRRKCPWYPEEPAVLFNLHRGLGSQTYPLAPRNDLPI